MICGSIETDPKAEASLQGGGKHTGVFYPFILVTTPPLVTNQTKRYIDKSCLLLQEFYLFAVTRYGKSKKWALFRI